MDNNKKPSEPSAAERWAKFEELDRKMKEEEEKYWARIDMKYRIALIFSLAGLAINIFILLTR